MGNEMKYRMAENKARAYFCGTLRNMKVEQGEKQ
jgi:hypothetical protein